MAVFALQNYWASHHNGIRFKRVLRGLSDKAILEGATTENAAYVGRPFFKQPLGMIPTPTFDILGLVLQDVRISFYVGSYAPDGF